MKKYDFIIIGCGISCLYFLKKVQHLNLKICILEKKPFIGGRIHTINIDGTPIDSGALRFTDEHKILKSLLKEYNITDIEVLMSKKEMVLRRGINEKWKEFLLECHKKKYQNYTFGNVAKTKFNTEEYEFLKRYFGYNQKWNESNCQSLAKSIIKNYQANKYYHLKNGLSQLPLQMLQELQHKFDFFLTEKVIKITDGNNIYTKKNHYVADHIIFACPPHYIKNIEGTDELTPVLAAIGEQILNRIYGYFEDGSWFPGRVMHGSGPISQVVPINKNVIMISYSTGLEAKYWIEREIEGVLWEGFRSELEGMGVKVKGKPVWIKQNYWNPGTHFYNPNFDPVYMQNLSFKPIKNKEWHIIGEAFSLNQGWIEGALENADLFCKKFLSGKLSMNDKKYSMKEVKKHNKKTDAWIVLYGNVYDVTEWIDMHPGGEVIMAGVGGDGTEIFKDVGHGNDALEFMNKFRVGELE